MDFVGLLHVYGVAKKKKKKNPLGTALVTPILHAFNMAQPLALSCSRTRSAEAEQACLAQRLRYIIQ